MNCPACGGRIKRLRTRDQGNQVKRYNQCLGCGLRIQSIELYLIDHRQHTNDLIRKAVAAEHKALQLSLNLDTIKTAFQHLHDAVTPLREAEDRQEVVSSLPARYTKAWRNR